MQKPTPPPADPPYVLFNRRRNAADSLRHETLRQIQSDEDALNALLKEFNTKPVVILRRGYVSQLQHRYRIDVLQLLKDQANAANRLFVELWENYDGKYHLTVKNTGDGAHLVANLLLIAKPFGTTDAPLTVDIKSKSWNFYFHLAEGKELLDAWLEWCVADLRAQVVLGFGKDWNSPVEFDEKGNFK